MKRVRKIGGVLAIVVVLLCSTIATDVGPITKSRAALVVRYFLYVDNDTFEVTKEQYEQTRIRQNDEQALVQYLREILGERLPSSFSTVSGRVVTTTDTSMPSNNSLHEGNTEQSDFVINDGVLIRYQGQAEQVVIPDGVVSISSLAFYNNAKVKTVTIPASVKKIDKYAFFRCTELRYVVFSMENTELAENIIYECDKLTNIVAPKESKAYEYAGKNDLLVTTSSTPQCSVAHTYLLIGDKEKNVVLNNIHSVKWKSSKSKIVTVSKGGTIKAKRKGNATITATANGKKYTYKVTVYDKSVTKRVNQVIKSCIKKNMSNYDKVKAVHNWMIRNVKYDYYRLQTGTIPKISHKAEGALMKKIAVCDGYAHAFQMIMNKLKIPCKFVVGRSQGVGHAWNMVKLAGKWYHVDVTFDDPIVNKSNTNTTPRYNYFLKSSATMSKSHIWKKAKYPKCTSKKYE